MRHFEDITVRAKTALRYLGIETMSDLCFFDIPPAGTILYEGFRGIGSLTLTNRCREELIALQDQAIRNMDREAAYHIGMQMLHNPEDYGLI